jgi:tetratricopeptide (TPR) repeat protein
MKTIKVLLAVLLIAGAGFGAGWRFGLSRIPAIAPLGQITFLQTKASVPNPERPANPTPAMAKPAEAAPAPDEAGMALATAIDVLTSPQSTFAQKEAMREQLRKGGRLPEVIAALKQLAAQNPNDANIPTALGEADLSQIRNLMEAGGDPTSSDIAILGLQADQNFNAALAADPTNWQAQFDKASAMSYWPASMNKGPEVIQRLSALVIQQEAATPQPEYALTYAVLGQQYQAAGQTALAVQTWQQGLSRFPLSSTLQQALTRAANPQP